MSGEISILGVVDRETYPSYNFRVRASDFGEPSPRSNLAQVELLVADVNDRLPVFEPEDVAGYLVYFIVCLPGLLHQDCQKEGGCIESNSEISSCSNLYWT